MKPIYILRGEERLGPFDPGDVQHLLNTGQMHWDEPAWTEGLSDWQALRYVLPTALAGEENLLRQDTLRRQETVPVESKPRPFLLDVPLALLCPLRGTGPLLLVFATAVLLFAGFLPLMDSSSRTSGPGYYGRGGAYGGMVCVFAVVTVICYYAACIVQVIRSTASGDDELSDVLDLAGMHDEMSWPLLQILGTVAGCLFPAGIAWYWAYRGVLEIEWLAPVLLAGGLFYLPMALLATTILGGVSCGLSPRVVIPAILSSLPRYLVILVFLAGTIFGALWASGWLSSLLIPILAAGAIILLVLYLGIVQARLLGLLFKNSPNRLGWFG